MHKLHRIFVYQLPELATSIRDGHRQRACIDLITTEAGS
jgi:hypothetical protein